MNLLIQSEKARLPSPSFAFVAGLPKKKGLLQTISRGRGSRPTSSGRPVAAHPKPPPPLADIAVPALETDGPPGFLPSSQSRASLEASSPAASGPPSTTERAAEGSVPVEGNLGGEQGATVAKEEEEVVQPPATKADGAKGAGDGAAGTTPLDSLDDLRARALRKATRSPAPSQQATAERPVPQPQATSAEPPSQQSGIATVQPTAGEAAPPPRPEASTSTQKAATKAASPKQSARRREAAGGREGGYNSDESLDLDELLPVTMEESNRWLDQQRERSEASEGNAAPAAAGRGAPPGVHNANLLQVLSSGLCRNTAECKKKGENPPSWDRCYPEKVCRAGEMNLVGMRGLYGNWT